MGSLKGLSWFVDGLVARLMYVGLHLMHHRAVVGTRRTALLALARFLIKRGGRAEKTRRRNLGSDP